MIPRGFQSVTLAQSLDDANCNPTGRWTKSYITEGKPKEQSKWKTSEGACSSSATAQGWERLKVNNNTSL